MISTAQRSDPIVGNRFPGRKNRTIRPVDLILSLYTSHRPGSITFPRKDLITLFRVYFPTNFPNPDRNIQRFKHTSLTNTSKKKTEPKSGTKQSLFGSKVNAKLTMNYQTNKHWENVFGFVLYFSYEQWKKTKTKIPTNLLFIIEKESR
jgi:hypothetical protein